MSDPWIDVVTIDMPRHWGAPERLGHWTPQSYRLTTRERKRDRRELRRQAAVADHWDLDAGAYLRKMARNG